MTSGKHQQHLTVDTAPGSVAKHNTVYFTLKNALQLPLHHLHLSDACHRDVLGDVSRGDDDLRNLDIAHSHAAQGLPRGLSDLAWPTCLYDLPVC